MCDEHGNDTVDDYIKFANSFDNHEIKAQHLAKPRTHLW